MPQEKFFIRTVQSGIIRGTLFKSGQKDSKSPAILFVHGMGSSEKSYLRRAEALQDIGYTCLTFSLRGHGNSSGNFASLMISDHISDVITAYDFLAAQGCVNSKAMHAVGASYGGYLVSMLSDKRALSSIVLRAPAIYPDEHFDSSTPKKKHGTSAEPTYRFALMPIANFKGNILVVESQLDRIISPSTIQAYLNTASKERTTHEIILGAGHRLDEAADSRFIKLLAGWFSKQK